MRERIRFFCRAALLIVDEIGYLPVIAGGGNLFFQLVNARYERGAMILTSNRGFAEWGEIFGDPVVATALARPPAASRRRRPDRGLQLPPAPARRPHPGKPPRHAARSPPPPTPRSTAKKTELRSPTG